LAAFGRAVDLGADAGLASLYDTALLGVNLSLLGGFYQAAALVGTAGVPASAAAEVVLDYLPFATGLVAEHAAQADAGRYPDDDGTLDVYAAAVGHLAATSRALGVDDTLPAAIGALLDRAVAAGHARDGLARLAQVVAAPGPAGPVDAGVLLDPAGPGEAGAPGLAEAPGVVPEAAPVGAGGGREGRR
jgi:hypothetical protein